MSTSTKASAFAELGLKQTIDNLIEEIQILYSSDDIPWIVGYSGGKDSSAVLSLVWRAVGLLPEERRHKKIHDEKNNVLTDFQGRLVSWL